MGAELIFKKSSFPLFCWAKNFLLMIFFFSIIMVSKSFVEDSEFSNKQESKKLDFIRVFFEHSKSISIYWYFTFRRKNCDSNRQIIKSMIKEEKESFVHQSF